MSKNAAGVNYRPQPISVYGCFDRVIVLTDNISQEMPDPPETGRIGPEIWHDVAFD